MNEGKIFEQDFKNSIPNNTYYLRIKDPPSSWGNNTNLRFSSPNPFDALLYIYPSLYTIELKTTSGTSFSFKGVTPMIKQHQIEALTEAQKYKGIIPGFIFNMRKYEKTYFLHINDFNRFLSETDKNSINQQNIINYGAIEVVGEIKRTRYKYFIGEFIRKTQDIYKE